MKARFVLAVLVASLVALAGCEHEARMSAKGFRLPDGNPEAGRLAFLELQCHQCHTIDGEQLPEIPGQKAPYIILGGDVTKVKTYGELVTAIINPSHKLARGYAKAVVSEGGTSKMYVYNHFMTVQQLIDIVTYLQPTYEVVAPEFHYRIYPTT